MKNIPLLILIAMIMISCSDDDGGGSTSQLRKYKQEIHKYRYDSEAEEWLDSSKKYLGYNVIGVGMDYFKAHYWESFGEGTFFLGDIGNRYYIPLESYEGSNQTKGKTYEYSGQYLNKIIFFAKPESYYQYSEKNGKIDGREFVWDSFLDSKIIFKYGNNGFVSVQYVIHPEPRGDTSFIKYFFYDNDNYEVITEEHSNDISNNWTLDKKIEKKYDDRGYLIEAKVQDSHSDFIQNFTYDEKGLCIVKSTIYDGAQYHYFYEYYDNGTMKEQIKNYTESSIDNLEPYERITYTLEKL
jgi:hypothetical protein